MSGENLQGAFVFQAEEEPVYLAWSAFPKSGRSDPDHEHWIEDVRPGLIGPGILGALRKFGRDRTRVVVVGPSGPNPNGLGRLYPLRGLGLPDAELVEASGA
ncbi:MAG: hypothetical protein ACYDD0_04415 [Candidatus Dormibacteria bacterium]